MDSRQDSHTLFVRLDRGEELFASLTKLAKEHGWKSAHVSGIGALEAIELGYFDLDKKDYKRKTFEKAAELISLEGNLCSLKEEPFFHLHAVLGDEHFQCFGGHLFSARVAVTAEINLRLFDHNVQRELEPNLKFKQLQFCRF